MMEHIKIENIELILLFKIENSKYGTIEVCKTIDFEKDVYVANNKIIKDREIINEIEKEAGLQMPEEYKNIIF